MSNHAWRRSWPALMVEDRRPAGTSRKGDRGHALYLGDRPVHPGTGRRDRASRAATTRPTRGRETDRIRCDCHPLSAARGVAIHIGPATVEAGRTAADAGEVRTAEQVLADLAGDAAGRGLDAAAHQEPVALALGRYTLALQRRRRAKETPRHTLRGIGRLRRPPHSPDEPSAEVVRRVGRGGAPSYFIYLPSAFTTPDQSAMISPIPGPPMAPAAVWTITTFDFASTKTAWPRSPRSMNCRSGPGTIHVW